MDVRLPYLHRRQAVVWSWRATHRTLQECLVAPEQRHRGCFYATGTQHAARGEQVASARLGEPGTCARAVEEGWSADASQDYDECVKSLIRFHISLCILVSLKCDGS